ncbi:apoptosis-inducing factor 1, mitochondrial-like [Corticium candelabrum]|uniref:apoptosis-inducing factor 1, mitochondrial-like n=1 Tax=Corticium candelabrum TaxID=121492 RepID=UPI002E256401|nr:apoptosis-inducing factor 1, mitochondrial-like [Corticium candelabrum]
MYGVLRGRGFVLNGIARNFQAKERCLLRLSAQFSRKRTVASHYSAYSASSTGSGMNTTLLIGSGVCLIGVSFAVYQLGIFNTYQKKSSKSTQNANKTVEDIESAQDSSAPNTVTQKTDDDLSSQKAAIVEELPILPKHVQYILIGGGTASYTTMKTIQEHDSTAKILIICEEEFAPYMRPPLSKELWFTDDLSGAARSLNFKQWDGQERSLFYKESNVFLQPVELNDSNGVAIMTGRKVVSVDADGQCITLDHGGSIEYDKLLIATGGRPKNLTVFQQSSEDIKKRVTLFRDISDFQNLVNVSQRAQSFLVVGGGFLGSELACALGFQAKRTGQTVTQVFREEGNMSKVLPKYLSIWTTDRVREEGVDVQPKTVISSIMLRDGRIVAVTDGGKELVADHVVVAVGIDANTDLAESAGLETDPQLGGYRVNAELGAASNIWVAGDASCFYDIKLGRRRVEHHDHAVVSGRLAGENMTGAAKKYRHQSMFWSDLGPKLGYEAIGLVDSSLSTVGVWTFATAQDTPAAATAESGSNIRSQQEEEVATVCEMESSTESSGPPALSTAVDVGSSISELASSSADNDLAGLTSQEDMVEIPSNFSKGVVFYVRDKMVVGVVLWNLFNQMPIARRIIEEGKRYGEATDFHELAKALHLYGDNN